MKDKLQQTVDLIGEDDAKLIEFHGIGMLEGFTDEHL